MIPIASGLSYFDLQFLGVPRVIAAVVLHSPGGVALVDPGPSSTLPELRRALEAGGIAMADVRAMLLTHIHLDHAGAAGTLVKANPAMRVFVHEKGAPHMAAPEKLIASATRLYGADMDRLWGEFLPVPSAAMTVLRGGERIRAGGRELDVQYTPGHAAHHVSFFDAASGVAMVGDTAGVRLREGGFVMPPTPPPDIDLEQWADSLRRIQDWRPETLLITHFGPVTPSAPHLVELADHLEWISGLARTSLGRAGTDAEREEWFTEQVRARLRRRVAPDESQAYEVAGRFDLSWRGLARYWRARTSPSGADRP
jgi:glyoxylase-like metal-dependent hydrolase (beta-lactamase superfamily II)